MGAIKESLTFDDVTLIPQYSSVLPFETVTSIKISKKLHLKVPILSSAMDTVTESKMAKAMARFGGLGVIHRNLSASKQAKEVEKVKKENLIVGAAVGTSLNELDRVYKLLESGVDLIVVDTAHGHTKKVFSIIKRIKKISKNCLLCAGNIATGAAAKFLADAGADIVKVGIGPGSICTTRLVAGIGVPQISAVLEVKKSLKNYKAKIISDGGIKFSGDISKALVAGADAVMIGSLFSGTNESPGKIIKHKGKLFKNFRGMGSVGAMSLGSAERYFQKKSKNTSKYVPEGVEGIVKYKGPVNKIIYNLVGGLKSSMGYLGAKTIDDLKKRGKFLKITKAGFYESMVHNVDEIKKL